jgi:hypothetical protein
LVESSADRLGICLGDDEHDQNMGGRVSISKLIPRALMSHNEMVREPKTAAHEDAAPVQR